jgi:hypothetical protein
MSAPPSVRWHHRLRTRWSRLDARHLRVPAGISTVAHLALPLAVLLIVGHTLLTESDQMSGDFRTNLLYIGEQAHSLRQDHAPTLFLTSSTTAAAFYPIFAFYGGTFFTFTGLIALLVGSVLTAAVIVSMAALAAAYGGWYWLARLAGLRRWPAHAPAIVFVTAPVVLTNIYVRHDVPEQVATSIVPLMVASLISLLKAESLPRWPTAAFAASVIVFSGTHNLTLLWGTTLLIVTGLLVVAFVPASRALLTGAGVLRVVGVAVPAIMVNAWFLVPDLAYASHTVISQRLPEWKALLHQPNPELGLGRLVAPHRFDHASGSSYALPALALAWTAVAAVIARDRRHGPWGRSLLLVWFATGALVAVISHPTWLLVLPDPWLMIQGTGRLVTYATFGVSCAVIAALRMTDHLRGWFRILLPACLLAGAALAVSQTQDAVLRDPPRPPHEQTLSISLGDYGDARSRSLGASVANAPYVGFGRTDVRDGRIETALPNRRGDVVLTNLLVPAEMLQVKGAHVVGRWAAAGAQPGWPPRWNLAIQIDDAGVDGQAHVVISEARTWPIVAGKVLSLLGVLGLVAVAVLTGRRSAGSRTRRGA